MASVFDVVKYMLNKSGSMTAMKLQKLAYYCQAWSLVWDEKSLFDEEIQAWANGPVCPVLFAAHKGHYSVDASFFNGNEQNLTKTQKETIDAVLRDYGDKSSQWLSDLTHMEDPWKNARENCLDGERCEKVITHESMMEYYGSL